MPQSIDERAAGYRGSLTQLKLFVRRVRPQPPPEPMRRFETPPGKQAQVDFARFRLPWGVRYALLVVLGYSRLLWLRFYPRQDMPTLFTGLEAAFAAFGGVPTELLFDQMRAVDTSGVEPMAHALDAHLSMGQRLRADEVSETDRRAVYQSVAPPGPEGKPQVQDGLYLVPRVVE